MGSASAGAKAGAVASLYFSLAAAALDAVVLLAFKSEVLVALAANPAACSQYGASSQAAIGSCYSSLFASALPVFFAGLFAVSFLASMFFGVYFEIIPGKSYFRKALLVALLMLVVMLNFVLPIAGDSQQELLMIALETGLAVGYAAVAARLYRRFTREVEFQSSFPSKLKIMQGRRDQTGKRRTYAVNSTQRVEAESEGRPFRAWVVSGGVSVEDSKNPNTAMKVLGDGLLKVT